MNQNIFEELQVKKQNLLKIADKAAEYGWIPRENTDANNKSSISLEEIKERLNKETLTIGVIGQMKCGKSTFLNSFVFKDDILPAATTPMTAALSVITYGEKEHLVAEFYTKDEWTEQKMQAERNENEAANSLDQSKIKAAKELVSKAAKLGASLENYLGKTQEDSFNNLIEYVGADGKFVSITKSVTIYYPHEYLKGVEIVDTPGFNDPIVSREERTKEFLRKADVVIMMLYAGRPFDATDRDIIFQNVRQCGIGKVLVGINKYDIPFCDENNPEDEKQIKEYVKSEIKKACKECNDNTLVEILKDVEPIPLSAEMALLSELPMSKISNSEALNFAWERHCQNFGISSQKEMYKWSHLDNLVNAVKSMIENEKNKILFTKPINAILAAGDKIKTDTETELYKEKEKIKLLSMPDSEIEDIESDLNRAHKRLSKKMDSLGDDVDAKLKDIVRKGNNELEDIVDSACKRLVSIIDNDWGMMSSYESIRPKLDSVLDKLYTRDLKRAVESISEEGKNKIKDSVTEFFNKTEDILINYLPDFDSIDFIKSTKNQIQLDIEDSSLFHSSYSIDTEFGFSDGITALLHGFTFGILNSNNNFIVNFLSHNTNKQEIEDEINSISNNFNPMPYLESAFEKKEEVKNVVREKFLTELIEPLQEQIKEINTKKGKKEEELRIAEDRIKELTDKQQLIINQLESISQMKNSI